MVMHGWKDDGMLLERIIISLPRSRLEEKLLLVFARVVHRAYLSAPCASSALGYGNAK